MRVGIGSTIAGWQLVALGPDRARLTRGGEKLDVAYGAAPVVKEKSAEDGQEGEEQ